jgi:hypothetical protein
MKVDLGLRGYRHAVRAIGAVCSVVILALIAGCDSGAAPVRIENHCEVTVQVNFSSVVVDAMDGVDGLDIGVIELAVGASSNLKPDFRGGGFVVIRREEGSWYTLAPFDREGAPKDRVYLIDGSVCTNLDG